MKTHLYLATVFASLLLISCDSDDQQPTTEPPKIGAVSKTKQLNINILWDLSDRIDPSKNPASPEHYQRDIEIIKELANIFKNDMDSKGAYMARGKIRVFFTPPPSDNDINSIAQNLSYDLSQYQGDGSSKKKKAIYDSIIQNFEENANKIYSITIANNKGKGEWDGSDIWRFFKNDADKVIDADSNYRNILVILTDGYIYHKDSKQVEGHRSQYILPATLTAFRNNNDWQKLLNDKDYGLMSTGKNLPNLEVLVLEVNPTKGNKNDEDYIKGFLEKWFSEMGITKYKIYSSDLPAYTKTRIESFIKG